MFELKGEKWEPLVASRVSNSSANAKTVLPEVSRLLDGSLGGGYQLQAFVQRDPHDVPDDCPGLAPNELLLDNSLRRMDRDLGLLRSLDHEVEPQSSVNEQPQYKGHRQDNPELQKFFDRHVCGPGVAGEFLPTPAKVGRNVGLQSLGDEFSINAYLADVPAESG